MNLPRLACPSTMHFNSHRWISSSFTPSFMCLTTPARESRNVSTSRRNVVHLLLGGVTDPICPQLVRKTVQNAHSVFARTHRLSSLDLGPQISNLFFTAEWPPRVIGTPGRLELFALLASRDTRRRPACQVVNTFRPRLFSARFSRTEYFGRGTFAGNSFGPATFRLTLVFVTAKISRRIRARSNFLPRGVVKTVGIGSAQGNDLPGQFRSGCRRNDLTIHYATSPRSFASFSMSSMKFSPPLARHGLFRKARRCARRNAFQLWNEQSIRPPVWYCRRH